MENVDEAMSRYAQGDATAFDAVYDAVAPQLARSLRRRVRDEARLEDIIQQTFLQMHHARGNFVIGAQVMPWAFAIARRLVPLQFAMFATRAIAHLRLGEPEEAVAWALKAARCPNAHAHILAIAVECLSLVNRRDEARRLAARIRERAPAYNVDSLLRAFHFDRDTQALLHRSARTIGFDS